MNSILGLPAHPLLVHGVVVLLPLAVLAALVYALVPHWRDRFYPLIVAVVPLAMVFVVLAGGSGEALQANVPRSHWIHDHAQAAGTLNVLAWVFTVTFLLLVALDWRARRGGGGSRGSGQRAIVSGGGAGESALKIAPGAAVAPRVLTLPLRVLLVAIALGVGFQIAVVGHTGAQAVWHKQKMSNHGD